MLPDELDAPVISNSTILSPRVCRSPLFAEHKGILVIGCSERPSHTSTASDRGRLNVLTRKTLGGLQTDLESRVLGADGQPVPGLYAAGEAAGFGGGGNHGYSALEGTFLGGCIFSGCAAGRAAAKSVG